MGKSVNYVFLVGRLTKDVDLRSTTTGKKVASFTLAVDKQTGEGADFFDCTAWEKLAELLSQYVGKGSKIHLVGRLQQETWEQDGNKRSKVTIVANDVTFLDTKGDNASGTKKDTVVDVPDDEPINLDDIPF